ncbi:DUF2975 domain-containing protein [Clostridium sp. P21]|uniref:DUF2975 domain-containing protein n=1 Tax=Clostridium muellerianum TaxID=2716538 RepID=A0A7Y0HKV5_9CLOT|nr:DUF2975 domain-containing protein [Clostridium muellerianum]NMM61304.1 DUF2975 domain-containing protein [Clostridium muellerianum]
MIKSSMEDVKKFEFFNTFLKVLFYIEVVLCILLPIGLCALADHFKFIPPNIFMTILFFISFISCIVITNELIKINKTLIEKNPFTFNNVKSMRSMAFNIFIIGIYIFIKDRMVFGYKGIFCVRFNQYGPYCDMNFLIFIIMGIFMIILSEIFSQSIKIKEDNDLTI